MGGGGATTKNWKIFGEGGGIKKIAPQAQKMWEHKKMAPKEGGIKKSGAEGRRRRRGGGGKKKIYFQKLHLPPHILYDHSHILINFYFFKSEHKITPQEKLSPTIPKINNPPVRNCNPPFIKSPFSPTSSSQAKYTPPPTNKHTGVICAHPPSCGQTDYPTRNKNAEGLEDAISTTKRNKYTLFYKNHFLRTESLRF